ncbi:MAG TPA: KTSC domain-containing protein [Acidimicrobiales bacterium]|nr:KTSC domain-containing protein [Acidimicrobiales bacterium]
MTSSNLRAVGYDYDTGEMRIDFNSGRTYSYSVPAAIYEGLMGAPSKGRYFAYRIRWRYRGRRVS